MSNIIYLFVTFSSFDSLHHCHETHGTFPSAFSFPVRITAGALPRGLHVLNLSRNNISTIEGLRELTRLRVLDLSYNRILRIGHGKANAELHLKLLIGLFLFWEYFCVYASIDLHSYVEFLYSLHILPLFSG